MQIIVGLVMMLQTAVWIPLIHEQNNSQAQSSILHDLKYKQTNTDAIIGILWNSPSVCGTVCKFKKNYVHSTNTNILSVCGQKLHALREKVEVQLLFKALILYDYSLHVFLQGFFFRPGRCWILLLIALRLCNFSPADFPSQL